MQFCLERGALSKTWSKQIWKLLAKLLDLSVYWTRSNMLHKVDDFRGCRAAISNGQIERLEPLKTKDIGSLRCIGYK